MKLMEIFVLHDLHKDKAQRGCEVQNQKLAMEKIIVQVLKKKVIVVENLNAEDPRQKFKNLIQNEDMTMIKVPFHR